PTLNKPQTPLVSLNTPTNIQNNKLQTGLQAEAGYQKYFNPFVGLSCYGHLAYRYLVMGKPMLTTRINAINRYSVGFGTNFLFNFYSKIRLNRAGDTPRIQSYGVFAGLLGVFNLWSASFFGDRTHYMRNNVNLNATLGLSMRINRFKWMFGVQMPLTNGNRKLTMQKPIGTEVFTFLDNYKSANLFLNFVSFY
ncbi:hypothetical protein, partial [Helicobacter baculiformis]